MINLQKIYHSYLLSKSKEHKQKYEKYKGWFSASSAGSCFIKQWLKKEGAEEKPFDERTMRLLRLGTIVHSDMADSIEHYLGVNASEDVTDNDWFVEHRIELPELNVVGHLDVAVHSPSKDTLSVYDIKTAHSFKWKKIFGRNIDPKPSVNYQLQLGTYGGGLGNELGVSNIDLGLIWYKKDDSLMKLQEIDDIWLDNAYEYWVELNETLDDDIPNPGDANSPVYAWECRYCPYQGTECDGI